MTTKSPAEAYSQQAEAISNQGKPMRWMDTAARLARAALPIAALGVPVLRVGAEVYDRGAQARREARDAQQFDDRLEQNYAHLDALARAQHQARMHQGQELLRAVQAAGRPANHDWRVGQVAGAASVQSRHRPPLTRYQRGARQALTRYQRQGNEL